MMAKVIFTLVALALQYLLLHSHKAGPSPWIWIASTSAVLMLVGVSSLRVVASGGKTAGVLLAILILLNLVLPPAIYAARERANFPGSVSNALAHDTWFYLASVAVASGGWLFALLLLWLRHRSARLLPKGTSHEP